MWKGLQEIVLATQIALPLSPKDEVQKSIQLI